MFLWFLAALVFRLRFQFSILSLLVLVVVVAVPFSWLATEMKAARKQREAVEWIEKADGWYSYDYQFDPSCNRFQVPEPPGPAWLRKLLGDDLFVDVTGCHFHVAEVGDAGLEHLKGLTQLQGLDLDHSDGQRRRAGAPERIDPTPSAGPRDQRRRRRAGTPQGVDPTSNAQPQRHYGQQRWAGAPQRIDRAPMAWPQRHQGHDAGLEHLKGLTQLQGFELKDTKVSDAGLEHLKGLTELQWLYLRRHQGQRRRREETPAGIAELHD